MADTTLDRIASTIAYLHKHKEFAIKELEEEKKNENWRMVVQIAYDLQVIDAKLKTLGLLIR